uniref:Heterogeneous nuclear ribonucleoprotein L RRM domain-containing protein n=1 Tax=Sinocyclocheilus anshuiensis TaxID=1608454 RepID=A0A671K7H9_9TELE
MTVFSPILPVLSCGECVVDSSSNATVVSSSSSSSSQQDVLHLSLPRRLFSRLNVFSHCSPNELDSSSETHRIAPSPVVHVRGLCESVVEADLVEALEKFGNICKRITRPTNADDPNSGNKVLLLSIQNPLYPITTDVLYTVCNPIGNVLRIVIFKRNGIQAMPSRLNVIRNDNDSWDYTKPFLLRRERGKGRQRQAILGEHPSSYSDNGYGQSLIQRGSHDAPEVVAYPLPQTSSYIGHPPSSVAMVSGLHPAKMNCTRIFNLFCLYGNIEKVMLKPKFIQTLQHFSLEMSDEYAVDRAITHLNSIKVFSKRINVCVSKQHAVIPSQVFELEDGSSSYKDFAMTRNNRFTSAGQASKNIIQPPSCVLHFYNVPPCITSVIALCTEHSVPGFSKYKVFDAKPSSKTISGLLEFDSKTHAVEVLTVLNHYQIRIPNKYLVYIKMCFLLHQ